MTNTMNARDIRKGDVVFNSQGQELTAKYDAAVKLNGQVVLYFVGYALPVTVSPDHAFAAARY